MKLLAIALCLVFLCIVVESRVRWTSNPELDEDWQAWMAKFGKSYTGKEEHNRRLIWESNLKKIQHHNLAHSLGEKSFTMGVNQFSDLTSAEFAEQMSKSKQSNRTPPKHSRNLSNKCKIASSSNGNIDLPAAVDWRTQGYVTPVKNSYDCVVSDYLSITGAIEGQWFRKSGRLIPLSEQNLVDCCVPSCCVPKSDKKCDDQCVQCSFDDAYKYIEAKGIESLADYPDNGGVQDCQYNPAKRSAAVSGYDYVTPAGNESALQVSVATIGPISVYVDYSQQSFQLYSGGVYDEPQCSTDKQKLDYAMLVVGYGKDVLSGLDYWIVKNNWGPSWGISGYIWMSRNKNNQCGIASVATFPFFTCDEE